MKTILSKEFVDSKSAASLNWSKQDRSPITEEMAKHSPEQIAEELEKSGMSYMNASLHLQAYIRSHPSKETINIRKAIESLRAAYNVQVAR